MAIGFRDSYGTTVADRVGTRTVIGGYCVGRRNVGSGPGVTVAARGGGPGGPHPGSAGLPRHSRTRIVYGR